MDKDTEFQKGWSTFFMVTVAITVPIYVGIGSARGDDKLFIGLLFFPSLTILYIGFRRQFHPLFRSPTMKRTLYIIVACSLFAYSIAGAQQKNAAQVKTVYKLYTNTRYHFSFEIPVGWKITGNGDGMDYTCKPVTKAEKAYYADYGEVFEFEVRPMNLDSAIEGAFRHDSDGAYYYNPPMSAEKKVDWVKGKGFIGLHEIHSCRASLNKRVPEETTVVDGCEQLYLSNGKITIFLTTNGIALEEEDYNKLIQTLRFL